MKPQLILLSVLCLFLTSVTNAQLPEYFVDFNSPTVVKEQQEIDYIDWDGVEWIATPISESVFHLVRAQVVYSPLIYYKTWDGGNWAASYVGNSFYNIMDGTGAQHGSPNINTFDWGGEKQTVGLVDNLFLHPDQTRTDWINYVSWDGTGWTAALAKSGGFILAPGVGNQLQKDVDYIQYVGWDNQHWTARLTSNGFHCVQQGTNLEGDLPYLYYHTRNYILASAKYRFTSVPDGFGAGFAFDIAPDKDHPLPSLQRPPLPILHHPIPPPPPSPVRHPQCASPIGATFIATADCWVGFRSDPNSSWGVVQLNRGQKYVKAIPSGQTILWGTGPAGTAGQLEINPKGSVGRCETREVSGF